MTAETAQKERPILFSSPMVRAILEGRKTQTRRPLKPQFPKDTVHPFAPDGESTMTNSLLGFGAVPSRKSCGVDFDSFVKCPYGVPGDLLWVRENFAVQTELWRDSHELQPIQYTADIGHRDEIEDYAIKPSIHMPRWASRITLELTGVRVERLNEISADDVLAEGVTFAARDYLLTIAPIAEASDLGNLRIAYRVLWDLINGKKSGAAWKDNPWVWVVEFRRISQ